MLGEGRGGGGERGGRGEGGGGGGQNSSTKNTKSSLLVPSLYIQAQQRLLWRGKTD